VSFQDQIGELSPKHFFEWMLLRCDDVDGKHTADQGRGRLHRDEASANDSNAGAGVRLGENASTVLKGPQHHHMRQVSSRNIVTLRPRPRSDAFVAQEFGSPFPREEFSELSLRRVGDAG
jgi:hypothetical protein